MDDDAIHARARELAKERIKPLTEQAETGGRAVTHENLSIKFFFNAANDMLKNGRQCVAEGDYERAYVLLMRFTEFFIHRLPLHAGFKGKEPAVASERKKLSKEVNAVLTELEMIKEEVLSKYTAEAEVQVRAELAEAAAAQAAAEAAAAAAAAQAEEQRAAAEALAVARAADEEEAAADARARQMERERAAQAAANADYYAELANRCQECSESDMPSYPSMDPRGAVGGAVPQPPPPGYGETVTAQSATLLQPPPGVVPPSNIDTVYGLPVAPSDGSVPMGLPSDLNALPSVPLYAGRQNSGSSGGGGGGSNMLDMPASLQQPPQTQPPPQQPRPQQPASGGLAALNMGSLSMSGDGLSPQPPPQAQSLFASSALRNAIPAVQPPSGGALDLSMPSGAPRKASNDPWSGNNRGASAASAATPQGLAPACNCKPPSFTWTMPGGGSGNATGAGGTPSALKNAGLSLRPLVLPKGLNEAFLRIAQPNTNRNIETCGILVGKIIKGELICDRVLIPNQTGTSDTCSTTNEDEIWEYCASKELGTFGWVHTHPSQTCFLSSVDLHTQCGYQSVLDEAVAIVLSPKHQPCEGVFRLCHPSPPGLVELQKCRKTGFHPDHQRNGQNAGNGVYEHVPHVRWDATAPVQMVDLRK